MIKKSLLIALSVLSIGCSRSLFSTDKRTQSNIDRDIKEKETLTSTRAGDTLTYTILNPILKDTTIYIRNTEKRGSNTLRIAYDSKGGQTIDCISQDIQELKETIRSITEIENTKDRLKTKEKQSLFNPIFLFYVFLGLAFLIVVSKLSNKLI